MRLQGKVAIVTGASSGIGLAIAKRFAAEGAKVVMGDINAGRLEAAVTEIKGGGGEVMGVAGDISKEDNAEALVQAALEHYGTLDILVNNAGIMDYMQGVGEVEDDIWRKVFAVNVDGPMYTCRRAVKHMLEHGGGSIVNVASTAGIHGGAAGAAYVASKHAVVGLTKNTAWMYAKQGIRCNAICPGATMTNISESMPQDRIDRAGMTRAGEFSKLAPAYLNPDDIAGLATYFAADESKMINGAIVPADGGWAAV